MNSTFAAVSRYHRDIAMFTHPRLGCGGKHKVCNHDKFSSQPWDKLETNYSRASLGCCPGLTSATKIRSVLVSSSTDCLELQSQLED
jgi:hypothetical protein